MMRIIHVRIPPQIMLLLNKYNISPTSDNAIYFLDELFSLSKGYIHNINNEDMTKEIGECIHTLDPELSAMSGFKLDVLHTIQTSIPYILSILINENLMSEYIHIVHMDDEACMITTHSA